MTIIRALRATVFSICRVRLKKTATIYTIIMMAARIVGMLDPAVSIKRKTKGIEMRAADRLSSPLSLMESESLMSILANKKEKSRDNTYIGSRYGKNV